MPGPAHRGRMCTAQESCLAHALTLQLGSALGGSWAEEFLQCYKQSQRALAPKMRQQQASESAKRRSHVAPGLQKRPLADAAFSHTLGMSSACRCHRTSAT